MATIPAAKLTDARQWLSKEMAVTYTKAQINAGLQAVENWFDTPAQRNAISSAINAATAPVVLTADQKKKLVAFWASIKFDIERA
jgi:hypothetical protein